MAQETEPTVELPAIPLRNMVMFPGIITALRIGRPRSVAALKKAQQDDGRLALITQRDAEVEEPGPADLYSVGVICRILQTLDEPTGGVYTALVEGLRCCEVREFVHRTPLLSVRAQPRPRTESEVPPELRRRVEGLFAAGAGADQALARLQSLAESAELDRVIAFHLELPVAQKQLLLEEPDAEERYHMLVPVLEREKAIAAAGERIRSDRRYKVSGEDRRRYLLERKEEIERRLADLGGSDEGLDEIRERVGEADLPVEVREEAERELRQLGAMPPGAPQRGVVLDYLEWLCKVPWNRSTEVEVDLDRAREVLDRDHYDREEVKERILEYLSVRRLRPDSEGALLCFVGAPGVGKTSLGRSIAEATGRRLYRVSLGGVRDEAEVRGHRRTYVGALPGRIIRALCSVGVNNPVLMLDELDKIQRGLRGDPVSALLEVLDPEQNRSFVDNYLAVPCDLSRVMFVGTANTTDTMPPALLDRLEVIELSGYSTEEKVAIARRHLIGKQLEAAGLADVGVEIDREALELLIEGYTREAGVRNLERQIAALCRKLAREHMGARTCCDHLDAERVLDLLGPPRHSRERERHIDRPGVCATLTVSEAGGRRMLVEVTRVGGEGRLTVTGRAGKALRESATLAHSFWKGRAQRFGLEPAVLARSDFHVHFPVGGTPKEGTGAGLPVALAFASVLCGQTVPEDVAVLGEITLSGRVLPVDRLEERLAAARRVGIRRVILPERNRPDVQGIRRSDVADRLEFTYVESVRQAVAEVLPTVRAAEEAPRAG